MVFRAGKNQSREIPAPVTILRANAFNQGDFYSVDMGNRPELGYIAEELEDFHASPEDLDHFDANFILGYFHRLELILDECPIEIYAASSLKHPWPYRLQKAGDCAPASFWRSQHRILDSNIMDPELTNEEILEEAVEKEATAVVAKDYLPFKIYDSREYNLPEITEATSHWEATLQSIQRFIDLHNPEKHPPAYIPVQPPYKDHIGEIRDLIQESHLEERYMLGGLKNAKPEKRIQQAKEAREVVGTEPILHGLGWGLSDTLVKELRTNPELIDSVDNSGPSQAVMNDGLLDKHWQFRPFGLVEGDLGNSVAGWFEFGMLLQAAHRLSKHSSEFDSDTRQSGLTDY